jgi:hypothetical protein
LEPPLSPGRFTVYDNPTNRPPTTLLYEPE